MRAMTDIKLSLKYLIIVCCLLNVKMKPMQRCLICSSSHVDAFTGNLGNQGYITLFL